MNLDKWDNLVGLVSVIWLGWFVVEFLTVDYDLLCFEGLFFCPGEPLVDSPKWLQEMVPRISLLILGFFVFDIGYRCGEFGNYKKFFKDWYNIIDVIITIPFFWLFEPLGFVRSLRMIKAGVKLYKAYRKSKTAKNKI